MASGSDHSPCGSNKSPIPLLFLPLIRSLVPPSHHPTAQIISATTPAAGKNEVNGECKVELDPASAMRRSVKQLHFGGWKEKEAAINDIRRLTLQVGDVARKTFAELGVIPKLVEVLGCGVVRRRRLAAKALASLSDEHYSNKALMVEAGVLEKLEELITPATIVDLLPLLLSISSLSKTPFHISPSYPSIFPTLIATLNNNDGSSSNTNDEKLTTLSILSNLSTNLHNAKAMVTSNMVPLLLKLSKESPSTSPGALATLGNLVATAVGRKAIEEDPSSISCFLEVMKWGEELGRCQELAAYILMVLVRGGVGNGRRVVEMGGVPVLLEVALLGTSLARRRATKVLEYVKGERKKGVVRRVHSEPHVFGSLEEGERGESGSGRREMEKMVKQSLEKNMERLMRRGNGVVGGGALRGSCRSKSFP